MIESAWNADPTLPALQPVTKTVAGLGNSRYARARAARALKNPFWCTRYGPYFDDARAGVDVSGARRDVDDRVVAERIVGALQLEDAACRRSDGSSNAFTRSSNHTLPGAQVLASKQPPPPWKKTRSFFGSPRRIQNAYLPPRAQRVAPPGSMRCQSPAATSRASASRAPFAEGTRTRRASTGIRKRFKLTH